MKKYGLLDKIPNAFKKKGGLGEGGNEKNSTATGGEDVESAGSHMPDPKFEDDGVKKHALLNTIQLPKNIRNLSKRLPKANYESRNTTLKKKKNQ
jgi:hypothetical protein